jgi:hypothetical protein
LVEDHLLACPRCRYEAEQLKKAVQILATDTSLPGFLHPAETAAAFGVSSKLPQPFGGQHTHITFISVVYALLGGFCLVIEFAQEVWRFAWPGLLGTA